MPQRKNPAPKKVAATLPATGESVDGNSCALDLPEDPDKLLEFLRKLPRESLFEESKSPSLVVKGTDRNVDGKYPCKKCKRTYSSPGGLRYHILHNCNQYKNNRLRYTCRVCETKFERIDGILNHIAEDHLKEDTRRRLRRQLNSLVVESEKDSDCDVATSVDDSGDNFTPDEKELAASSSALAKTSTKSRATGRVSSQSMSGVTSSFASIRQPFKEVMGWLHNFLQDLENKYEVSHPNILSKSSTWIRATDFELGELSKSPPFQITGDVKTKVVHKNEGLDALSAIEPVEYFGVTFNAGGPVWALSWCPESISNHGSRQYLAVSTHSDLHSPEFCYSNAGLIQIWDCGVLRLHNHEDQAPIFSFGLSVKCAPIWDLKWCRIGGTINNLMTEDLSEPRLGILAAACANGTVLILPIPDPCAEASLRTGVIYKAAPEWILLPCGRDSIERLFGQCLCVDWTLSDGGQWLAGGFSKGLVALWKIHNPSTLLLKEKSDVKELIACRTFHAHIKPIRSLCWCPYDSSILATCADDRYIKVWNRSKVESPVMETSCKISSVTELVWPILWCGIFSSTDNVFSGPWAHGLLYQDILNQFGTPSPIVAFKSSCCTLSFSDWMNCVVGGDATGLAVIYAGSNWSRKARNAKVAPRLQLFLTNVNWKNESTDAQTYPDHELLFRDVNLTDLTKIDKRACFTNAKVQDSYPSTVCDKPFVQSVNRMRWNPNFGSHTWIASGLQSGLVRLHCVYEMHYGAMDEMFIDLTRS